MFYEAEEAIRSASALGNYGKPTHRFVLGLGTLHHPRSYMRFWMNAVHRMAQHGLSKEERKHFVQAISRKGVRLPTKAECKEYEGFTKGTCYWNQGSARKLRGVMALTED